MDVIEILARKFSKSEICTLDDVINLPNVTPTSPEGLMLLENNHKSIMLYMWLRSVKIGFVKYLHLLIFLLI